MLRAMLVFTACDPSDAGSSGGSRGHNASGLERREELDSVPLVSGSSAAHSDSPCPRALRQVQPRAALAAPAEPRGARPGRRSSRVGAGGPRGLSPTSAAGQRQRFLRAPTRRPQPSSPSGAGNAPARAHDAARGSPRTSAAAAPCAHAESRGPGLAPGLRPQPLSLRPRRPAPARPLRPPEARARWGPRLLRVPRAARGSGPTPAPARSARDVALPGLPRTRGSPGPTSRPRGRTHAALTAPAAPRLPRPLTEDLPRVLLGAYAAAQLPLANPDLQLQRGRVRERTAPLGHGRGPAAAPFSRARLAATRDVTAARQSGAARDRPGARAEAGLESDAARDRPGARGGGARARRGIGRRRGQGRVEGGAVRDRLGARVGAGWAEREKSRVGGVPVAARRGMGRRQGCGAGLEGGPAPDRPSVAWRRNRCAGGGPCGRCAAG